MTKNELIRLSIVFVLSGATVVCISLLSNFGNEKLAGVFVIAPVLSFWSFLYVDLFAGNDALRKVVYSATWASPSVLAFSFFWYPGIATGLPANLRSEPS